MRCKAPISRHILRNRTPSSVVSGDASNSDFRTMKGKVGRELASADVSM